MISPPAVAFQLEPSAEPEVTGDGQEPAWNALGVGAGIPHVVGWSVIGPPQLYDMDETVRRALASDGAAHPLELGDQILHVASSSW
jgi:hypothetical protein